jgi:hypothetical protein
MHRESIVWVIARSRHQQHTLNVSVVFQVTAEFLLGKIPRNPYS